MSSRWVADEAREDEEAPLVRSETAAYGGRAPRRAATTSVDVMPPPLPTDTQLATEEAAGDAGARCAGAGPDAEVLAREDALLMPPLAVNTLNAESARQSLEVPAEEAGAASNSTLSEVMYAHHNTTMENDLAPGNLRQMDPWLRGWLHKLKSYFLFAHIAYIVTVMLISATVFFTLEKELAFVDALFVAASCVSCTGLSTVDVSQWSDASNCVRHLTMIAGGMVFTSGTMPLLRIVTLRKLRRETVVDVQDSAMLRQWKRRKRVFIDRLETTAIICAVATYVYWALWQLVGFFMLLPVLGGPVAIQHAVAAFQSCSFMAFNAYAGYPSVVLGVGMLVATGASLYPVLLRIMLTFVARLIRYWYDRKLRDDDDSENGTVFRPASLAPTMGLGGRARLPTILPADDAWNSPDVRDTSRWMRGLETILRSKDPSLFHFFLFSWGDTIYLAIAFALINAVQMVPFLSQQWSALLDAFAPAQKIIIALSQSIAVRFAGATFVDVTQFSNVHVLWILFAMYIPVVPIPTDRSRRKWREMFSAGAMRLLTSRIFLLFLSTSIIVWVEEARLLPFTKGTAFDVSTRVLFETISAYSTSGMTLPLPNSAASFSGSLMAVSKVILAFNMIVGRHRWMDLGIDIGLDELEASERRVNEMISRQAMGDDDDYLYRANSTRTSVVGSSFALTARSVAPKRANSAQ